MTLQVNEARFVAERLSASRKRRGLTITALSDSSGISTKSLSDFENGKKSPAKETAQRLAQILDVPLAYFSRSILDEIPAEAVSFRAPSKMSARNRDMALSIASHAVELRRWIDGNYDTPAIDVPTLHKYVGSRDAVLAAEVVRAKWGLGEKPLGNIVHLLELHGIAVFSIRVAKDEFDAFSFRENHRLFVLLNTTKSAERGRFDAAHELGHLVLHCETANPTGVEAEREANAFASAFLMPEADVRANMPMNPSIELILKKKSRWGVAAIALAYRLHDLGMLSDWLYQTACVNLSRLGYRSREPGGMDRESSKLLSQVMTDLWQTRGGFENLCSELAVNERDINDLVFNLAPIAFTGAAQKTLRSRPDLKLIRGNRGAQVNAP